MTDLRVGTYNVRYDSDPEKIGADLYRLSSRYDVIALTEAGGKNTTRVLENLPAGWKYTAGNGERGREVPILYNAGAGVTLVEAETFTAAHGRHVAPSPGHRAFLPDLPGVEAAFRLAGGKLVTVINTHAPRGVEGRRVDPARVGMAQDVAEAVAKRLRQAGQYGAAIASGDWNEAYRKDGSAGHSGKAFHGIGARAHWSAGFGNLGTFGSRRIDTLWALGAKWLHESTWVGQGFVSDHRPTGGTLRF